MILARVGRTDAEAILAVMTEAYDAGRADAMSTIEVAVAAAVAVRDADGPRQRGSLGNGKPERWT